MTTTEADPQEPKRPVLRWAFLLAALVAPTLAALFYFQGEAQGALAQAVYAVTKLSMLVLPVVAYGVIERRLPSWERGKGREHLASLPIGLLTGVAIGGSALLLYLFSPLGDVVRAAGPKIVQLVEEKGIRDHYVPFAAFLALAHSLLEEYYWRWFVFGQLKKLVPKGVAYAVASLGFASHHYVVLWVFFSPPMAIFLGTLVGVGGALWCVMYERQRSLMGTWLSHCLVDVGVLWIGYLLIA